MKKLLFISVILLFITSCDSPSYENTVEDLTVSESIEILSLPSDTIIVKKRVENEIMRLYEVKNDVVIAQYSLVRKGTNTHFQGVEIFIVMILVGGLGLLLGSVSKS